VKPAAFSYHRAETEEEAAAILADLGDEGRVLAGGQSLVPMMNFRLAQPEHLVDINRISSLQYVRREDGFIAVGATARQHMVEHDENVKTATPLIVEALKCVAHPPIRHRGTVVGSIAHADPAAELPSVAVATRAILTLRSASVTREVAADDFFLSPFETVLVPGEFVTEVRFPAAAPGTGQAFAEFSRRRGDFAIAGAAVSITLHDMHVNDASIVLCAVGPKPMRATSAEALLKDNDLEDDLLVEVVERALENLEPRADIHGGTNYRIGVARVELRRALAAAINRAKGAVA
jgi:carbon-monoxide dehydrogenase medium subunit